MTDIKDMAVKPGMTGGAAGDGQHAQGPKKKGKGAAHGWRVLFLSCFLCTAVHQGKDNDIPETRDRTKDKKEKQKKEKLREKERKKQEKKGKALGWYDRLLGESAASTKDDKLMNMTEEKSLRQKEEGLRKAEAYEEALLLRQEKDRMRLVNARHIERSRKATEANVVWSSLPMRADNVNRVVTFRDQTSCKVWATIDEKKPSQRDLEWRRVLDEVRKTEKEKVAEKLAEKLPEKGPRWLIFLKGISFNLKTELALLFLAYTIVLFARFCANALSSSGQIHYFLTVKRQVACHITGQWNRKCLHKYKTL